MKTMISQSYKYIIYILYIHRMHSLPPRCGASDPSSLLILTVVPQTLAPSSSSHSPYQSLAVAPQPAWPLYVAHARAGRLRFFSLPALALLLDILIPGKQGTCVGISVRICVCMYEYCWKYICVFVHIYIMGIISSSSIYDILSV